MAAFALMLMAGCGTAVAKAPARSSRPASGSPVSFHVAGVARSTRRRSHGPRCPPHFGFPLCPLPTLGFPTAGRELARVYRTIKIPPSAHFGMQTPVKSITDVPSHVLAIEYGVEHAPYPYTNPCTGIGRAATIRGDPHATVCVEPGRLVIVAALWHEMGTTWQATLSSNHTKPYTIPELVRIIDGWHTTGERPLPGHL